MALSINEEVILQMLKKEKHGPGLQTDSLMIDRDTR